jgi:hypothetical protein
VRCLGDDAVPNRCPASLSSVNVVLAFVLATSVVLATAASLPALSAKAILIWDLAKDGNTTALAQDLWMCLQPTNPSNTFEGSLKTLPIPRADDCGQVRPSGSDVDAHPGRKSRQPQRPRDLGHGADHCGGLQSTRCRVGSTTSVAPLQAADTNRRLFDLYAFAGKN